MNNVHVPLSEEEMNELDHFLLNRGYEEPEEAFDETQDEGILNISELDGFLTAIVSGPVMIMPSRWLPVVWGDVEPVWESPEAFEHILVLMMRHMNGISSSLMDPDFEFEPIFMEREVEGKTYTIVDEWCFGYLRGVSLSVELWHNAGEAMEELLGPINLFGSEAGWAHLEKLPHEVVAKLQREIPGAVRAIHTYWLERRSAPGAEQPYISDEPKVGRNDHCPCNSGKKYKKCCLH